ncbi:GLPGLI family protein [Niabella sp. CJ426]|jgi:GLPGLI family protein|uniref:GLPGLI family protein n=1 Tax=Niabella sp. CJ426 TaxID=3393740 RepID=UPI003CFCB304
MKQVLMFIILLSYSASMHAQKFIGSGTIEFEVKTNLHKSLSSMWGDEEGDWAKQLIASQPQMTVNYYKYNFHNNRSEYKFDRSGDTKKVTPWLSNVNEDDMWYNDYTNKKFVNQKAIDDNYIISGDLKNIEWKLSPNDVTVIAGFNCRKAQTVLFDSVYVFVYYTDEITVNGGPMSLNGLPGMILGVTIPRMYTSWIATQVTLGEPVIKEPTRGKKKTEADMLAILTEVGKSRAKEWKNATKWMNPMIWRTFL